MLIFQADSDKIVSPESASYIYNNVESKDKELIFLTNSTHSRLNNQQETFNKLYKFIVSN